MSKEIVGLASANSSAADRLAELDITLPEPVVGAREMQKLFPDFPTDLLTEDELESELLKRLGVA